MSRGRSSKPTEADGGALDESTLGSAIGNGEDLGTIIRAAFEIGRPESLLGQLRGFVKKKEVEIEELCRVHYEDFIRAVDELRNVLVDAELLKERLRDGNSTMQDAGKSLLAVLDELIRWHGIRSNLAAAAKSVDSCAAAVAAVAAIHSRVDADELYPALKALDKVERDMLERVPSRALCASLQQQLPAFRLYVEKKVSAEFNDWLVDIRSVARHIGQLAIGQAAAARQREEELRARQRQAEEQSRWGSPVDATAAAVGAATYILLDMEEEEEQEQEQVVVEMEHNKLHKGAWGLELTPVYRAHYIHACLGLGSQFRSYYLENRRLQLMSDLHVPPGSFLECHQAFLAQLAGFFIVEDRVLRTAGGLVSSPQVEALWESACSRVVAVLDDQLCRLAQANHMLLVKDSVSLLAATLASYGYAVSPLLDSLGRARERYHELLIANCRRQVADVLANDKFEQMLMRKEYEYTMNVLAFGLQSSDVTPAFPYVAPFSASVPDLCRVVRGFMEDSVAFLSGGGVGGGGDYYHDTVCRYSDKLVTGVVNEALLRLIRSHTLGMSQAMQLAANLTVLERACDFWAGHVAALCGLPPRLSQPLQCRSALKSSQVAAQERMLELVKSKVDEFMVLTAHIDWAPDEPPQHGNAYLNEVVIYLETLTPSAQAILPPEAFNKWIRGVLKHISDCIVATLAGDEVRRFNLNAAIGIDADLRVLESFAAERGGNELKACLAESRQLVNLLLANQPELYLNPVIREKSYSALDPKKLLLIAEKYRDLPEKLFRSTSGGAGAGARPANKKKSFDTLVKRLREFGG